MQISQVLTTLALAMPALVSASALYPSMGCYSEVPDLKNDTTNVFNSYGLCADQCRQGHYKFAVLSKGDHCGCSNAVPPPANKVADDQCKTACPGYPEDICGGNTTYSVLNVHDQSNFVSSMTVKASATTTAGGIVVAASTPASTATATNAETTAMSSASASASASATPSFNAASSMREGSSLAGVLFAGLALLL
ncbi:hypothetical protein N7539_009346 [Penicillium diatomitis]|uniref:WSC domain-containing protein n=1 Tax=Penicillium diatomitis TaxID=2819901 RepID=A0A9W9WMA4_9EURO|nr:uncharacterized protein N7539_009346 [Penicillium diatomitis]KAJ5469728.1 hypothetical protein N7539_009346 [Penicillium diatomitis]